jgi:transcriptional regulator with XRE-family HTH domain
MATDGISLLMGKSKQNAFAERLRTLRESAGLSQYRLAQLSGITKQSLSRLELGQGQPTFETVLALARGLGVEVGAFAYPLEDTPEAEAVRPRGRPPRATAATKLPRKKKRE